MSAVFMSALPIKLDKVGHMSIFGLNSGYFSWNFDIFYFKKWPHFRKNEQNLSQHSRFTQFSNTFLSLKVISTIEFVTILSDFKQKLSRNSLKPSQNLTPLGKS